MILWREGKCVGLCKVPLEGYTRPDNLCRIVAWAAVAEESTHDVHFATRTHPRSLPADSKRKRRVPATSTDRPTNQRARRKREPLGPMGKLREPETAYRLGRRCIVPPKRGPATPRKRYRKAFLPQLE